MNIKNKIFGLIIKTLIVIILITIAVLYLISSIDKQSQSILDKKIQSITQRRQQETRLSLLSDFKKIEQYLEKVNQTLPSAEEIAINLSSVFDNLAFKNNIQLSFRIDPPQIFTLPSTKHISIINFNMNLSGTLDSFNKFLEDMENLPYFVVINRLDINGNDFNSDAKVDISGTFYAK